MTQKPCNRFRPGIRGSAVSHLVGGGVGNLLSSAGGIAGSMIGGPLGGMIGSALGNLVQNAVGEGIKGGIDQLQKEYGLPKFLANALKQTVDNVVAGLATPGVSQGLMSALQHQNSGSLGNIKNIVQDAFVSNTVQVRKQRDDEAGATSAGGRLQAIAKAMGTALGNKASEMVKLSGELQGLTGAGNDTQKAKEFNMKMTEFQATGQECSMLNSVFSTAIKSIGEAMSSMARKQ